MRILYVSDDPTPRTNFPPIYMFKEVAKNSTITPTMIVYTACRGSVLKRFSSISLSIRLLFMPE
jgi:hypothetical protein